jgi:signal transduction histidine kinase
VTDAPASEVELDRDDAPHLPSVEEIFASLHKIVAAAIDMIPASYGAVVLFDDEDQVSHFLRADHDGAPLDEDGFIGRPGAQLGALYRIARSDQPIRVDDVSSFGELDEAFPVHPGARSRHGVVAVPIRIRGRDRGALILVDRLGNDAFDDEDARRLVPFSAAVTASVENGLLYREMSRREHWLEASNEVTTAVLSGVPDEEVLALIAKRVSECTPADGVAILLMESDGRMVVEHATGDASELFAGMVADSSWSSSLDAIHSGEPMVIPDLGATGRSDHPVFRSLGPCMVLPMRAADQTLGAIAVTNYRGGRVFDPMDLVMAQAFAGQSALAAVLSQVRSERERLIVFEERDRIARDLHDLVIQRLFATGMMLQGAGRGTPLPPDAEDRVTRAVDELDATIREIRQTIFALNQAEVGEVSMSLRGRILHEVAAAVPTLGFQPHLRIEGAVDTLVPDDIANQLVAATREALANVARHAQASAVDVHMNIRGDEVVLEVIDDGVGIREGGRRSGLRNLAARAANAGGGSSIWPVNADGTGTRLTWQARIR